MTGFGSRLRSFFPICDAALHDADLGPLRGHPRLARILEQAPPTEHGRGRSHGEDQRKKCTD